MVEWKKLGDIFEIKKGRSLSKDDIGSGDFPVILYGELYTTYDDYITTIYSSVSTEIAAEATPLKYNDLVLPVSSTTKEAQIGKVSVIKCKEAVSLGGDALIFRSNLNADYLMYYLNSQLFEKEKMQCVNGTTIMHLSPKKIADKLVPLPSPEEQSRIVGILDTFTASIANLKEQIGERRKQYEHYRDQLLDLEGKEGVEMKTLKEICVSICSGGTPSTSHREYYNGNIPWLRTQEVDWKDIYDTEIKITQEAIENSSAKIIPSDCVIVAMYGATAAKVAINRIPLSTNQACCNLNIDKDKALLNFVYYWLCKEYQNLKALGEGAQHNISAKKVKDYPILIPSLSEQSRIVSILDQFEASIANLEAQLQEREKQYEHYRNLLLTFE